MMPPQLRLRHPQPRLHLPVRAQRRLAALLLLLARHLEVPGQGLPDLRPAEVHDLPHRGHWVLLE